MIQSAPPLLPSWTTRRVILATLVVLAVAFSFWLLYRFHAVVFILFAAIVIGIAIQPAVAWLQRRGVHPALGGILVYLTLLVLLIGFAMLLVPLVVDQIAAITTLLPDYYQNFRELMISSPNRLMWRLGQRLPPELPLATAVPQTGDEAMDTIAQTLSYVNWIGWGAFVTVATLLLGFYWVLEEQRVIQTLLLLAPMQYREGIREIITAIEVKVGAYVRGQTFLCVIIGLLSLIAYLLIGLPYALVLALIAGVMEAVPLIGPVLGALPAALLALSSDDPYQVVWVAVATLLIQQLENNVLAPRIMDRSVGINPIVTLLSLTAFGTLLGIPGAILAIPMAAIIQLLLNRFLLDPGAIVQEKPTGRDALSVLRYEAQDLVHDVRKQVRQKGVVADDVADQIETKIEALAVDLDSILAQAAPPEVTA